MRAHLTLAFGFLLAAIFAYRGANALLEPGFGLSELYVLGGLIFAGWFMFSGSREILARSKAEKPETKLS